MELVMPTARRGTRLVYELQDGEQWAVLSDGRVVIAHPDREPKIVWPPDARRTIKFDRLRA